MASAEAIVDSQDKSESKHLMVCAIDFGTTFTGFAFSFRDKYADFILSGFQGGDSREEKAPTCLLLNPDKSFYKFGFAAKTRYKELLEDGAADEYFFFERFKMELYKTKRIRPDVKIADSKNKFFPAMDIFSKVIKHLREEIERSSEEQLAGLQPADILWVLTVPAIWSDSAKSFMRKAAVQAGIPEEQLVLCLEPEAASLWCLGEKACKTAAFDGSLQRRPLPVGQKYIIADLGGGTADLSVHEILSDRNLREIRRSDGGAYGGNLVNDAFFEVMQDILGKKVIERMSQKGTIMHLEDEFEKKKKQFKEDQNDSYRIALPVVEINEAISDVNDNESLEEKFAKASDKYCNNIALINKKHIEIKKPVFEQFFAKAVDGIVGFIKQLRTEDELNEINVIFMVGGFSEASYIRNTIRKRVPGLRILIPPDPAFAVMKGAVLMGHKPRTITSKISRFTYGLSVLRPFQKEVDPERFKVIRDGIEY